MSVCLSAAMPHPQRFSGDSLVAWQDLDVTVSVPWFLGLMFRTRRDGVLLDAWAGASSRLLLQVSGVGWGAGCSCSPGWHPSIQGRCPPRLGPSVPAGLVRAPSWATPALGRDCIWPRGRLGASTH